MQDVTKLPRWGEGGEESKGEAPKGVRFPFKPEFNSRIALTKDSMALNLKCDVIVVATNDKLDASDCLHERIVNLCGPEFRKETRALAPLKVTEPRVVAVPDDKIPAKNVMTMLPPRYTQKYVSAAVNSLNKSYLNAIQACIDNGYRTIVFTAIHDLEHKFDSSIAAEVVVRTIRRFFEHNSSSIDLICLCLDGHGTEEYTKQMKLYFPRSNEEAANAEKLLPKDVGNEWGEMVVESRSIRISSLPGMGGDDDDEEEEDQMPEVVGKESDSLEYSQGQPNPDVRNTQGVNDPSSPNYIPPNYVSGFLNRAATLDLRPLDQARFFYEGTMDSLSHRNIAVLIGKNMMLPSVNRAYIMPYIAHVLDSTSFNPFTIVYIHCAATNNSESMFWIHSIASSFPRRYLFNMRIAVVYPTFWLKTHFRVNRFIDLRPVEDISYYDNLAALFRVIGRDAVRLPDDVLRADLSVTVSSHDSSSSQATSASSKPGAPLPSDDDNL